MSFFSLHHLLFYHAVQREKIQSGVRKKNLNTSAELREEKIGQTSIESLITPK